MRKAPIVLLAVVVYLALAGCEDSKITEAKVAVRERLKDPDSAQFRNVVRQDRKPLKAVCGEVNAKNSMGGYVGYSRFYVTDGGEVGILSPAITERDRTNIEGLLKAYCD